MKRSEALGKIYTILYKKTDLQENLMEDLSNTILDALEEQGMLPPIALFYEENGNGNTGCSESCSWEPENG